MAQYFTDDFSGTWTDRFDAGSTFATDWTVSSGTLTASAGSGDVGGRTLNSVSDDDDVEVLFSCQVPGVSTYGNVAMLRGSGSAGSPTCYTVAVYTSRIRVYKWTGSETPTTLVSANCTLLANTTYWIRFRVNTNDGSAKIWADGGSESSPLATATWTDDNDVTGSGWAGPFLGSLNGGTWYQFGWGTNGDTAPSSASSGAPTITALSAIGITATSAQPQISYS